MAISLVIIDGTIVNTIFPSIINDLGLTSTEVQWVQESYVLVFASLLLVWGSLADRFGRKRLLSIGIIIFILASVWAGVAETSNVLILARVIQGIGGAMVLPTTLSLLNATFQGKAELLLLFGVPPSVAWLLLVQFLVAGWQLTSAGVGPLVSTCHWESSS
jgi:MFS family permease